MTARRAAVCLVVAIMAGRPADGVAQPGRPSPGTGPPGVPASAMPAPFSDIGFDQRLDERVPLDLPFRDETGRAVRLGDYFGETPVILAFVYFDCPMLCTQVLHGLAGGLKGLSLDAGRDFTVVAVSIDPADTPGKASARRRAALDRYGRPAAEEGWHLLTGDAASIRALTDAVGFRYVADPLSGQFGHAAGVTILTPGGAIARYLFGIDYAPRDLRLAIVEASGGRVGTPVDQVLLYCYLYDPAQGKYGLIVMRLIRLGAIATMAGLAAFILVMRRKERSGSPWA
jgi:protein SCO1/2